MELGDQIGMAALVVSFGALIVGCAGIAYTRLQIREARVTERAKLVKKLYDDLFENDECAYVYSLLEQQVPIFARNRGTSDPDETARRQRSVERLLAKLEGICGLHRAGLLEESDLGNFDFNIRRISQSQGFAEYRHFLEKEWPESRSLHRGPYADLFWYLDTVPPS